MTQLIASLIFFLNQNPVMPTATVRFQSSSVGKDVTISLDGGPAETVFAGKLGFQDRDSAWQSVCADVRSPIRQGEFFVVAPRGTQNLGGRIAKAGNIVAHCFAAAKSPEQCAGLQLAVWKTMEDGADYPSFMSGRFRAQAGVAVMVYAQQYYQAADSEGNALFLQSLGGQAGGGQSGGGGGGQSQMMPGNGSGPT